MMRFGRKHKDPVANRTLPDRVRSIGNYKRPRETMATCIFMPSVHSRLLVKYEATANRDQNEVEPSAYLASPRLSLKRPKDMLLLFAAFRKGASRSIELLR